MLDGLFRAFGFGLCHQLPERSFFGGGVQLPVCARDTGIYLGFVAAFALIHVLHRGQRPARFPSTFGWVAVVVFIGSMAVDGVSSYAGLRATTNELRLLTGVATGFALAAIVVPLLNYELWARFDEVRVLTPGWRLAVWALGVPATTVAVWVLGPMLGIAYPFLVTVAILFTFGTVNMLFAAILPAFDRKAERTRDLLIPVLIGLVLTGVEIIGAAFLRLGLEALARSIG